MHIIATFRHSVHLELALAALEAEGLTAERILAVPLDTQQDLSSSRFSGGGKSNIDVAFICAAIGMLLGCIYGFVLSWGPVLWGCVGLILGWLAGYGLDKLYSKRKRMERALHHGSEVVVIANIGVLPPDRIEQLLWTNRAEGVARVPNKQQRL